MEIAVSCLKRLVERLFYWWVANLAGLSADRGHLEVERKFAISQGESLMLPDRLASCGFAYLDKVFMTDTFLPVRTEGEMGRVRVERNANGTRTMLTHKTWSNTTGGGRERQESETPIGKFTSVCLLTIGRRLKGAELLSFGKHRELFSGHLNGRQAIVSIDQAEGLGKHTGFYLEVEVIVPLGEDVTSAREYIFRLVQELLGEARDPVKLSYLQMLELGTG